MIGGVQQPPFAVLPAPSTMFDIRSKRFTALAARGELVPYLRFLAALARLQHETQSDLPQAVLPSADALERAGGFGMPLLDRETFAIDAAFDATFQRLLAGAAEIDAPVVTKDALRELQGISADRLAPMIRNVLSHVIPGDAIAGHVIVAVALQVHFARLATQLDVKWLGPVGDALCPCCGGPPVASLVVGWQNAHGARYCACSLCGTLWNYVRIRCTQCGSTKGISYQEIGDGAGTVKAETCDSCHCYVKILYQDKDVFLEPVADDVATLGLDLLMRGGPYRRAAANLFLIGY
jgi:FdhE protein